MNYLTYVKERINQIDSGNMGTGKKLREPMIGYRVDFSAVKEISDYIKSWLDRYNITYEQNKDVHVTIAQTVSKYSKDKIVRTMGKLPSNFIIKPKRLMILYSPRLEKYFVTIELRKDSTYVKAHDIIKNELPGIKMFPGGMKPHISLFTLKKDSVNPYIWDKIVQKDIKLPKIKLNSIQLFNSRFMPEFLLKK